MRISRISVKLLLTSIVLFVALFFVHNRGVQIRNDDYAKLEAEKARIAEREKRENPNYVTFAVHHAPDEIDRNWAENLSVGILIVAFSTLLSAVWMRNR